MYSGVDSDHLSAMGIKTRAQLATEFGITPKTFREWCRKEGITLPNRGVGPRWQKLIYSYFFYPDGVQKEDYADITFPRQYDQYGNLAEEE